VEVEQTSWPPEHSEALREHHAKGLSYSRIAKAINARFGTCYTRNAALGRAKRMGLEDSSQSARLKMLLAQQAPQAKAAEARVSKVSLPAFKPAKPACLKVESAELRCVDVDPRHLSLVELERNDCRYPYGGEEEGEAITFCGHPRRAGSSYCTPHFHLTRDPVIPEVRAVSTAPLRLVDADEIFERVMETNPDGTYQAQETAQSRESA
jgi:GcrA cell cycle regulator